MKRKVLIMMMLCVIMMSICPVMVFAHSGSTDGDGGHYNRSTGEYHWHHGYSAHQHEDMDGDGDLDCPYDFDDQTNTDSGSSSGGGSTYRPPASPTPYRTPLPRNTPSPTPKATESPTTEEKNSSDDNKESRPPMWIIFVLSGIAAVLAVSLHFKIKYHKEDVEHYEKKIKEINNKHETKTINLKAQHEHELSVVLERDKAEKEKIEKRLTNDYDRLRDTIKIENSEIAARLQILLDNAKSTLGQHYLSVISGAPDGHFMGDDGLPTTGNGDGLNWGNPYTFFAKDISNKVVRYHSPTCLHRGYQVNAYTVRRMYKKAIPCKICSPELPQTSWVDTYYKNLRLIDEIKELKTIKDMAVSDEGLPPPFWRTKQLQEFANGLGTSYETAYRIIEYKYENNKIKARRKQQ